MAADGSFAGKFMKKIKKLDSDQIEAFLANVLREKAFLEVVLDSVTEGIVVVEKLQRIVFVNDAACQLLDFSRSEAMNRSIADVLPAGPLRALAGEFDEAHEQIRRREVTMPGKQLRVYSISIVPVENEDNLMTHSVWIVSDRTDYVRRQKERAQMENMESLAVLTAGVAHEVKNPLNSLNIHAQLASKAAREYAARIGEDPALERLQKSTGIILEEIDRLRRVVDDFIKAVRPVRPELRRFSINKVIEQLAELLGPDCARRGIELALNLDPEIPPTLMDPEQMHQALLNIIKNAMEAIEDDRSGHIVVRTHLKSDHLLTEVEDNGCGIAEEERLRIFEPYHSTKFGGTGLGLVLVYRIVRAHRGAIGLTSEPGVGTAFSIALPLDERPVRLLPSHVQSPSAEQLDRASRAAEEA